MCCLANQFLLGFNRACNHDGDAIALPVNSSSRVSTQNQFSLSLSAQLVLPLEMIRNEMEMEIVKAEERQGLNEGPALFVVMGFVSRN